MTKKQEAYDTGFRDGYYRAVERVTQWLDNPKNQSLYNYETLDIIMKYLIHDIYPYKPDKK